MGDHGSYERNFIICKKKAWTNSGLNAIPTHDLSHTDAALYQRWAIKPTGNWTFCELVINPRRTNNDRKCMKYYISELRMNVKISGHTPFESANAVMVFHDSFTKN